MTRTEDAPARGTSYPAALARVTARRGPVGERVCAECGTGAQCWSYDGTDPEERTHPGRGYRYSLDPDRYRPRCRSCHRRATVARGAGVVVLSPDQVNRVVRLYQGGATLRGLAALLRVNVGVVRAALRAAEVELRTGTGRAGRRPVHRP